ncbi:MAG: fumarylacetoacetate hydrolase family protein [Bifidobacteriaceae bacterium]|jgi:2-keto-4-pentenoate hydratase/2-oxohepta-3-ene-1,7-dioic acid hydratase in catechol pathway|nr:fumarylacetoacetate hydrolase family protein [Bifidobacteriaceae bacterium]
MRFARLGPVGSEIPAVQTAGTTYDLRPLIADIDGDFLEDDPVGRVTAALPSLPVIPDAAGLRFGPPVARPGAIYCIGRNYAAHAREGGAEPPKQIVVFLKPPHTMTGPNDTLVIPVGAAKTDWEVELGVVIGQTAWQLSATDDGLDYIAGYATANDLSEREWQLERSGGQWSKGKSMPGFLPFGPWLVPAGSVEPDDLRLTSFVNGQARQDCRTTDLIFDVSTIIKDLSQFTVLEPGDVVLTGTPEGVALSGRFPFIKAGDVIEVEVEGLGRQHQVAVAQ